jgi:AraC-like DNA-binding protein
MSFKQVRGASPREMIMGRRLEIARQMLLDAEEEATITAIATSLGFFELGRFSQRPTRCWSERRSRARMGPGATGPTPWTAATPHLRPGLIQPVSKLIVGAYNRQRVYSVSEAR